MSKSRSHHKNPYRSGNYNKTFGFFRSKRIVTKAEVLEFTKQTFGVEKPADVTVLLSPRKESKRGDCRGNISAQGHLYFMQKLNRATKMGVKEPQRYMLRWREVALEPRTSNEKIETVGEKVAKEVVVPVAPIVPAVIE
jgi:hypothetical protein